MTFKTIVGFCVPEILLIKFLTVHKIHEPGLMLQLYMLFAVVHALSSCVGFEAVIDKSAALKGTSSFSSFIRPNLHPQTSCFQYLHISSSPIVLLINSRLLFISYNEIGEHISISLF